MVLVPRRDECELEAIISRSSSMNGAIVAGEYFASAGLHLNRSINHVPGLKGKVLLSRQGNNT